MQTCMKIHTHTYIYIYIYIYINVNLYIKILYIKDLYIYRHHHHHVVPPARISLILSLVPSPYRSSPLAGLQGYIPYPHIAAVCMFQLVVLLLPGVSINIHKEVPVV